MSSDDTGDYVSRAGVKLAHALKKFGITPAGWVCADLGASTGGFTDCLLRAGAAKVFAVERGYGVLDFRVRRDSRVVVMERTDALHVTLPKPMQLVTIDAGWTRQALILPVARRLLGPQGQIITLVKPHYEAEPHLLVDGVLSDELIETVLAPIRGKLLEIGLKLIQETASPIRGSGGNAEVLWQLNPVGP